MKSKLFLITFFLFFSVVFVNAQSKEPQTLGEISNVQAGIYEDGAPIPTTPPDPDPKGKVVKAQKPVAQSNEKISATTNGKSATAAPKKKIALVKTSKTTSSK